MQINLQEHWVCNIHQLGFLSAENYNFDGGDLRDKKWIMNCPFNPRLANGAFRVQYQEDEG